MLPPLTGDDVNAVVVGLSRHVILVYHDGSDHALRCSYSLDLPPLACPVGAIGSALDYGSRGCGIEARVGLFFFPLLV